MKVPVNTRELNVKREEGENICEICVERVC